MKTVNKTIGEGAGARFVLVVCALLSLTGCASEFRTKVSTQFKETPKVTETNITGAIACMANTIQRENTASAYIFLVRDVKDGTVRENSMTDGPLSDAGRIMMLNTLSEHVYPHAGLVPDTFPFIYLPTGSEESGLNRYGLPSPANMQNFLSIYQPIIQSARKQKNLPPVGNIVPLIVSAQFSRFDSDNLAQEGIGHNAGTRTKQLAENEEDSRWRKFAGEASVGSTESARLLSLVVNLIDPRSNLVVGSQSFDLIFYRNNQTFRIRAALGDGYYGFSKDNVVVEGVHTAQKVLIDAATLWILNKAYGLSGNFAQCFTPELKQVTISPVEIHNKKEEMPSLGLVE